MRERFNPSRAVAATLRHWAALQHFAGAPELMPVEGKAELGCGGYGCVFPTNTESVVYKVTSDVGEARFARAKLKLPGVVSYYGVVDIGDDLFALWREEATHVGDTPRGAGAPVIDPERWSASERRFVALIREFRRAAENVDAAFLLGRGPVGMLMAATHAKWAEENIEYGSKELLNIPLGPRHTAAWIRNCAVIAEKMAHNRYGAAIGRSLVKLIASNILVTDIRLANLGEAHGVPVITDPGIVIPLYGHVMDDPPKLRGA